MPAHAIIIENFDVDPRLFKHLAYQVEASLHTEVLGHDTASEPLGRFLFLFHQRKPGPISEDQRDAVLSAASKVFDGADGLYEGGGTLFLIDCGVLADDGVHSDLSLLADMTQQLARHVGADMNMDIILIDHEWEGDDQAFGRIFVRRLSDPSVVQNKIMQAMEALVDVAPDVPNLSKEDIDAVLDDVMARLREDLPPEIVEETRTL